MLRQNKEVRDLIAVLFHLFHYSNSIRTNDVIFFLSFFCLSFFLFFSLFLSCPVYLSVSLKTISKKHHIMESHDCLKVSMCKLVDATVRIFDRIHILLDQIYKSLGGGVIILGADNKLLYALVIIFGRHSILFNQLHTSLGAGAIILDAADKLLCVQVIIFGLNNIVLDAFAIPLSAMNIIVGSKTILRSTCASW